MLFILPVLRDTYPPELKEAVSRRRQLAIDGECPCGASMPVIIARDGGLVHRNIEHEADCPAPDAPRLYRKWKRRRR